MLSCFVNASEQATSYLSRKERNTTKCPVNRIRLTNHTGKTVAEFRRLVSSCPAAWGEFSDPIDWEGSQARKDRGEVVAYRESPGPAKKIPLPRAG
jgi:hypothetical protein